MSFVPEMTGGYGDEVRIILGRENCQGVSDHCENDPGDPELQP